MLRETYLLIVIKVLFGALDFFTLTNHLYLSILISHSILYHGLGAKL